MEHRTMRLTEQLLATIAALPDERVAEVIDFAEYLRSKDGPTRRFPRGSPEAILHDLDTHGPLIFEPGDLSASWRKG